MMYKEHGRRMADKLWKETLQELEFANVAEVLGGLKH